jgi:MoaA/NifB/PqqE/SkfB family radical SAM enzyme
LDKINPCLFRPLDYPARSVVWEVTKRCNLKCPHCCNNAGPDYEDLSQVDADRLLTIIANNGVKEIYFSGGEPLLWKPLVQIISRANFLGIQCCIATSGFIDDTKLLH